MGQLTNLFVSESYQGLLKLTDSTTGVTGTLQYVQDGVGNNLPIQVSNTEVIITGSLIGTASYATQALSASWAPDSTDTGSLVTTSSFNAFTSSIDGRVDALEVETGSLQNQINQKLDSSSFNSYTSSNDSKVNSLINSTGSYATTSSLTTLSGSIATTDLGQDNRLSSLEINSGSQQLEINQKLDSSSFNSYTSSNDSKVNSLISQTGSYVTETESGSFMITGSVAGDTLTFTKGNGSQFSLKVDTGSLPSGVVSGSAQIVDLGFATTSSVNSLSSSIATTDLNQNNVIAGLATTSSLTSLSSSIASTDLAQDNRLTSLEGVTGSINRNGLITTGSIGGTQSITGSLNVEGTITATSASFTYVNTVYETASVIYSSGSNQFGDASDDTQTLWGKVSIPSGPVSITGSLNASGSQHTIVGNTLITGALKISSSATYDIEVTGSVVITRPVGSNSANNLFVTNSNGAATIGATTILSRLGNTTTGTVGTLSGYYNSNRSYATNDELGFTISPILSSLSGGTGNVIFTNDPTDSFPAMINFQNKATWTDGRISLLRSTDITGSLIVTDSITGSLQGTASYATQALSASYAPLPNGIVSSSAQISYTGITDVPSGIISGSVQISDLGFATTSSVNQKLDTGSFNTYSGDTLNLINQKLDSGSFNSYTSSNDSKVNSLISQTGSYVTETESGSFVTNVAGGPISFEDQIIITKGDGSSSTITVNNVTNADSSSYSNYAVSSSQAQNAVSASYVPLPSGLVSGSVQISDLGFATTGSNTFKGDQVISGSLLGSTLNDGQIRIFSDAFNSGAIKMNVSSSAPSAQSNIIFGSPLGGVVPLQFTGSIVISGSNNIVMGGPRPNTLVTAGTYGYLGGNTNIFGGQSTLNTGSSYRPLMNTNVNFGTIAMTLGSGSGNFNISSNALFGGNLVLNMPSASIGGGMATNIIAGQVTLQQSQAIPLASSSIAPAFNTNNVNGTFNLQTNSGSFQVVNNNINGNNISVTSSYRATTVAQNAITLNNNSINGLNHRILLDGVAATTKGFSNNLIVGANNTGSMVTNDTNGISNTGLIGQGLHVESGNISGTGGSLIVGRYNGTGSLSNPGFVKFAVGTGNSNTNRRTSLWVDENSKVSVSGSLDVSGSVNVSGSAIRTNNFLIYDGSPNEAGPMTNFVSSFMNDKNTFTFNNIVQSQLSTGSNFSIQTNTGSTFTQINFKSAYAGTETQFTVGNFNGSRNIDFKTDTMNVTGSLNVTGSVSIANAGDLTMYGHKMFNVGAFTSTQTQSGSAAVSQSINYDITDISQGVSLTSGTQMLFANAGTYNIQFSAQVLADTGADDVWFWLKKNGTNVTNSAGRLTLANNEEIMAAWNYVVEANAGDYYELVWESNGGDAVLLYNTAAGNYPAVPSVITTVTQVR